jgi:NADPH:quinone reductase-like Zn-dependent oxidoreductase
MDIPIPSPGEVLVKVAAAAINPSDVKNVAGLFSTSLPRTPGRDFSDTVVSPGIWQNREVWGSGAVGYAAIQIAHWKGARVIGVGISDRFLPQSTPSNRRRYHEANRHPNCGYTR